MDKEQLLLILQQLVDWYRQQPDGQLPFGLVNGFFIEARGALKTQEAQAVEADARC